jgi:hypothetical protein
MRSGLGDVHKIITFLKYNLMQTNINIVKTIENEEHEISRQRKTSGQVCTSSAVNLHGVNVRQMKEAPKVTKV